MILASKASFIASGIILTLIGARAYYTYITGYILPDEAFYMNIFILHGGLGFSVYRPFLHVVFTAFFWGTSSPSDLAFRGALFCSVWAVGCVFMLQNILERLQVSDRTSAMVIVSLPLIPVFSVMAVFFVTETLAFFLALAGIYFSLGYLKSGGWKDAALSALFLLFASQVREPYLLLLFGNFLLLAWMNRKKLPLLAYALVAGIAFPVPKTLIPFAISQPVSNLIFEVLPNLLIHGSPSGTSGSGVASIPAYVFQASNNIHFSWGLSDIQAFAVGLVFGFTPVFIIFLTGATLWAIRARNCYLLGVSALCFLSYYIIASFAADFLPNASSLWISNLFRLSSAALPSILLLSYLYQNIGGKRFAASMGSYFVIGLFLLPTFSGALQSSQNLAGGVNRLSLDYRAPYLRMYDMVQPGSLIVTNVGIPQMELFASWDKNVTVAGLPANLQGFDKLTHQGWTKVYLYDDWVSLQNRQFFTTCQCYPQYFVSILYNRSLTTLLWSDGESYAEVVNR